jgi:hypothetical protein
VNVNANVMKGMVACTRDAMQVMAAVGVDVEYINNTNPIASDIARSVPATTTTSIHRRGVPEQTTICDGASSTLSEQLQRRREEQYNAKCRSTTRAIAQRR